MPAYALLRPVLSPLPEPVLGTSALLKIAARIPNLSILPAQTTKAHITVLGGVVEELVADAGLVVTSDNPFKVRGRNAATHGPAGPDADLCNGSQSVDLSLCSVAEAGAHTCVPGTLHSLTCFLSAPSSSFVHVRPTYLSCAGRHGLREAGAMHREVRAGNTNRSCAAKQAWLVVLPEAPLSADWLQLGQQSRDDLQPPPLPSGTRPRRLRLCAWRRAPT